MNITDLHSEKVAILGTGIEGLAVASWLKTNNITFSLIDEANLSEVKLAELKNLSSDILFGADAFKSLSKFTLLFRSPGIKRFSPSLNTFCKTGGKILSATSWFFEHCPCPIIGVTGTNGKGTTVTLIQEILTAAVNLGKFRPNTLLRADSKIWLFGNIGVTPLKHLGEIKKSDIAVFELSSFQLEDMTQSPHIAVVLMITSEHLNHHNNLEEYHEAKSRIVKFQKTDGTAIYTADYPASFNIGNSAPGNKYLYSLKQKTNQGLHLDKGWLVPDNLPNFSPVWAGDKKIPGDHNYENIMAATLAAWRAGAQTEVIENTITNFNGLPHRLQSVAEYNGIKFIDDSISTTPEATIAAIKSFAEPIILLLGGSSKGANYSALARCINKQNNIKFIILSGETAKSIETELIKENIKTPYVTTVNKMPEIFEAIWSHAKPGDVVLLSPGCASFDGYKNYKDRGEQFIKLAKERKNEK